ncbi:MULTISPECIES: TRAP transporter large permease [Roseobacteraceae]|uniref:TRAP transporter large permease n=1 Tax=Roseobacteraceae TaxID=2854170 RepID=UPI000C9AB13F|nr:MULTISPECIES: TRAP transporter large permease [Roseobacteraceae]MBQ4826301.1 TRAP transporter large permease [Leisingera sp. HS039]MCF6432970.1 TRAP transporter large permease [Leisingera sp. MMG026]AUQ61056.1 TRAP dicarboxylate transporter-DctM subunit [Phaeobacter inhibens]AUQ80998.1 TRAP dicarboxylate transporter-DctM subunit [Phaeobacter inhibens]AUQ88686.1 TRAP dicarboxylate transporter-DctM subunit [Phaeobacter inhibens]
MIIAGSLVIICGMLLLGVSVYVAFGAVLLFLAAMGGHEVSGYLPSGSTKLRSLVLLAIPLFMIAGTIMERGKIAAPLVSLAELFIGHLKGGLSAATVLACGIFGSISGAANATLTCIGSIMMPHLRRANYPEGQSAALIVCASPLGLLIPPSGNHILYGWVAQQSVLKCFLSTVVPALILITLLIAVNQFMLRKYDDIELLERPQEFGMAFRQKATLAFPALLMPLIILGGIYGGIMTPTEAAGVAVVYAIPVAIYVYRGLTWRALVEALTDSGVIIGVVMVMIFMVLIVSKFLIFEDIPNIAKDLVYSVSDNPIVILLMVNLVMILIGMLMDDISGLLLSTPILLPIVQGVGMDPIHFAAVLGVNLGMANITPPTAPLLYLGAKITKTPVSSMLLPTLIFIIFAWLPTLALTTFVPEIALWLPELLLG